MSQSPLFQQLFDSVSCTFTYLLADHVTREAVLIDPVLEKVDRDLKLIQDLELRLVYVIDTHVHADHVTGAGEIRRREPSVKTVTSKQAQIECTDLRVGDGDRIPFGSFALEVLETPGHTDASMSFHCSGLLFTGDTLLIRGCGRTDFQGGSSAKLFASVRDKLFKLSRATLVYPGHDYNGFTSSSIGAEMDHNPRLGLANSLEKFEIIMAQLKLPYPKQIDTALSMNLSCGVDTVSNAPIIEASDLDSHLAQNSVLIDVRTQKEFESEMGHIRSAHRVTLGEGLQKFLESYPKNEGLIFVCQSGRRSQEAARAAMKLGFTRVASLGGGMQQWHDLQLPVLLVETSHWYPMI